MSVSGRELYGGCSCCSSIWVRGLISRMSCFFCFSAFPIGVPNHCGQWGETLLWPDFSTLGTCSVFAAKCGEETPISTDTWQEEDLKEKYIFINQQYDYMNSKYHLKNILSVNTYYRPHSLDFYQDWVC